MTHKPLSDLNATILFAFTTAPHEILTAPDVAERTNQPIRVVRRSLQALADRKLITRVEHGYYSLLPFPSDSA